MDDSQRLKIKDELLKRAESDKDFLVKDYGQRLSNAEMIIKNLSNRLNSF